MAGLARVGATALHVTSVIVTFGPFTRQRLGTASPLPSLDNSTAMMSSDGEPQVNPPTTEVAPDPPGKLCLAIGACKSPYSTSEAMQVWPSMRNSKQDLAIWPTKAYS